MELYLKYRPKKLTDVKGQDEIVKTLLGMVKKKRVPRAIMFHGPSGCGKTTLARILKSKLKVDNADFRELNCALIDKPLEAIKDIQSQMYAEPWGGHFRMWLLDEVQSLTRAKFAMQGLLDILENMPNKARFVLCTTDPQKIIKAVHTRCSQFKITPLSDETIIELVKDIWKKEGQKTELTDDVLEKIAQVADGSARQALVTLEQLLGKKTEEEMIETIQKADFGKLAIDIARALMNPKNQWGNVAELFKGEIEEAEGIRRLILAYSLAVLLNQKKADGFMAKKASVIMNSFRDPIFETGKTGKAILALCAFDCYS